MTRYCPGCGKQIPDDAQFCPHCGRTLETYAAYAGIGPQDASVNQTVKDVGHAVGSYTSLGILALLLIEAGFLVWSISVILPIATDPAHGTTLYLLWPGPNPIIYLPPLNGLAFGLLDILIVAVIVASLAYMIYMSAEPLRQELRLEMPKEGHSPLYRITTILLAVLAVDLIYTALILIFNVPTSGPALDTWQALYAYASASVWEELITRVLWIGVPLLIIDLAMRKRGKLSQYLLGGSRIFGAEEMILIWVSASIFALGHSVYWDPFKLIPTFAAGIGFGFLFIRYGLYSCILLHFANDYISIPAIVTNSDPLLQVTGIIIIGLGFIGIPFLIVYLRRMVLFVTGKDIKLKARRIPVPVGAAAPASTPAHGEAALATQPTVPQGGTGGAFFTCAYCGWHEARMVDGELECTRCLKRQ